MRKKNKLYTANKWNQPLFAQGNVFDAGGNLLDATKGIDVTGRGLTGLGSPTKIDTGAISSMKTPSQGLGLAIGNIAKSGIGALGSTIGTLGSKLISGGYNSGAGNVISGIGNTVGGAISMVNPVVGGIVSAASGILGGATNALFGTKVNQARLNAANQGTDYLRNFKSDAASFEDIQGPEAQAAVQNAYKGGLFRKSKARRRNAELVAQRDAAESWANRSVDNNIDNIADTQMDNMLGSYYALGGPLGSQAPTGAIDYGFMSDYLTMRNKSAEAKNKISTNPFGSLPVTPLNTFALGGDLQTNGSDFSDGLQMINAGGSHESSPYNGVQVGVDPDGKPNLVEEGETIFDDYVFSNRIKPDVRTKKKFHVGKNSDMSYADLSKKLEKESEERPNDAISQAGLKKQMHDLAEEQERQKGEMQQREAEEASCNSLPWNSSSHSNSKCKSNLLGRM